MIKVYETDDSLEDKRFKDKSLMLSIRYERLDSTRIKNLGIIYS